MSKKLKKKKFRLTFQVILRLLIFAAAIYFLISYLSGTSGNILGSATSTLENSIPLSEVTGNLYHALPPSSQKTLDEISRFPITEKVTENLNHLRAQSNGFPQKQIADIQKYFIRLVADELVKKVDNQ